MASDKTLKQADFLPVETTSLWIYCMYEPVFDWIGHKSHFVKVFPYGDYGLDLLLRSRVVR